MSNNPFANWTPAMVKAHNERVAKTYTDAVNERKYSIPPFHPKPFTAKPSYLIGEFATELDSAAIPIKLNPIQVAIQPSTDERKLNKTELAFLLWIRHQPNIERISIQAITLKLADDCRLTPDFFYLDSFIPTFIDVKGFQREDALIKMKVAARLYSWAAFWIVKKDSKSPLGWAFLQAKP